MFQALPKSRFSRHVERLNLLSSGAGSLLVPKEVKSVELVFKNRSIGGHLGAKKFWRENLPRVQFFNPSLPITVIRVEPEAGEAKQVPAVLKVEFKDGEVKKVDVKHKHSSEILKLFVKMTGSTPAEEIVHTPQL